jgi:hypothetical protein
MAFRIMKSAVPTFPEGVLGLVMDYVRCPECDAIRQILRDRLGNGIDMKLTVNDAETEIFISMEEAVVTIAKVEFMAHYDDMGYNPNPDCTNSSATLSFDEFCRTIAHRRPMDFAFGENPDDEFNLGYLDTGNLYEIYNKNPHYTIPSVIWNLYEVVDTLGIMLLCSLLGISYADYQVANPLEYDKYEDKDYTPRD